MIPNILTIPGTSSDRRRWIALVVVCFGQLMIVLDSTIVNVALSSIQRDLHFSQAGLTWVVNAYLITYGSFVLLAGRAGDLVGRKKVFLTGVFLFTAASVLCGFAQDPGLLIAGRFLQGAGAALSAGVVIALIVTGFTEPGERAQAMSVFTFTIAGGGSLGLLAGGLLTQWTNWHWIFFINLPIGVATLLVGRALIEENEGLGLRQGVDVLGSILVSAALAVGVYAIVTSAEFGWASAHTLGLGGAAVALLAAFVWLEARLENPILPLRILRIRSLTGASAARALLATGMRALPAARPRLQRFWNRPRLPADDAGAGRPLTRRHGAADAALRPAPDPGRRPAAGRRGLDAARRRRRSGRLLPAPVRRLRAVRDRRRLLLHAFDDHRHGRGSGG